MGADPFSLLYRYLLLWRCSNSRDALPNPSRDNMILLPGNNCWYRALKLSIIPFLQGSNDGMNQGSTPLCRQSLMSGPIPRGCVGLPNKDMSLSTCILSSIPILFHIAQIPSATAWPDCERYGWMPQRKVTVSRTLMLKKRTGPLR